MGRGNEPLVLKIVECSQVAVIFDDFFFCLILILLSLDGTDADSVLSRSVLTPFKSR